MGDLTPTGDSTGDLAPTGDSTGDLAPTGDSTGDSASTAPSGLRPGAPSRGPHQGFQHHHSLNIAS